MNIFARFYSFGAQDADRRVAEALTRPELEAGDRYVGTSIIVVTIDRLTRRLREWWLASQAGQLLLAFQASSREPSPARFQSIALALLAAVIVHVTLTVIQGPRPGWFWMVIPSMTAVFAVLMLAGSRSSQSH